MHQLQPNPSHFLSLSIPEDQQSQRKVSISANAKAGFEQAASRALL
jgi:hypothetical protein